MPSNRSVSDSHIATVTRRRAAIQAARNQLSMGADRGAPQAPTRAIPSMPPTPVPSRDAQQLPAPTAGAGTSAALNAAHASTPTPAGEDPRAAMLAKAKDFLNQQRNPGAQPIPEQGIDTQVPGPDSVPLSSQINALGGAGISPEQQFYRIAGRLPSGRELATMRTTVMLEQQLNRRPTANELRAALMRPSSLSNSFQAVVGE